MTDIDEIEALWTRAKSTQDIHDLAAIGNTLLDEVSIIRGMTQDMDYTLLARVQWITARMEFIRTIEAAHVRATHEPFKPYRGTPTGRLTYNEPHINEPALSLDDLTTPVRSLPDDRTRDLTDAIAEVNAQMREPAWCGASADHQPHPIGEDKWCMGGPPDA